MDDWAEKLAKLEDRLNEDDEEEGLDHDMVVEIFGEIAALVRSSDALYVQSVARDADSWVLSLCVNHSFEARVFRNLCEHMIAPFLVDLAIEVAADAEHDVNRPTPREEDGAAN